MGLPTHGHGKGREEAHAISSDASSAYTAYKHSVAARAEQSQPWASRDATSGRPFPLTSGSDAPSSISMPPPSVPAAVNPFEAVLAPLTEYDAAAVMVGGGASPSGLPSSVTGDVTLGDWATALSPPPFGPQPFAAAAHAPQRPSSRSHPPHPQHHQLLDARLPLTHERLAHSSPHTLAKLWAHHSSPSASSSYSAASSTSALAATTLSDHPSVRADDVPETIEPSLTDVRRTGPLNAQQASPHQTTAAIASGGTEKAASDEQHATDHPPSSSRPVARQACLKCRACKRRCDGAKPICGQCRGRGVHRGEERVGDGGGAGDAAAQNEDCCVWVQSRRGGPRVKGQKVVKPPLPPPPPPLPSAPSYARPAPAPTTAYPLHHRHLHEHEGGGNLSLLPSSSIIDPKTALTFWHQLETLPKAGVPHGDDDKGHTAAAAPPPHPSLQAEFAAEHLGQMNLVCVAGSLGKRIAVEAGHGEGRVGGEGDKKRSAREDLRGWSEEDATRTLELYYLTIYPICPILLPRHSISRLATQLSNTGPSALLSAITAMLALHPSTRASDEPESEAEARKKRADYHVQLASSLVEEQCDRAREMGLFRVTVSPVSSVDVHRRSAPAVAVVQCLLDVVATLVLLATHHYGQSGHGVSQAVRAFEIVRDMDSGAGRAAAEWSVGGGPILPHEVEELRRRCHWITYGWAILTSIVGGHPNPVSRTDERRITAVEVPVCVADGGAWPAICQAFQLSSRNYRAVLELGSLSTTPADAAAAAGSGSRGSEAQMAFQRAAIFANMWDIDSALSRFLTAGLGSRGWDARREMRTEGDVEDGLQSEREMAKRCKQLARFIACGGLIVLHRGQAFGGVGGIFTRRFCGMPEAPAAPSGSDDSALNPVALTSSELRAHDRMHSTMSGSSDTESTFSSSAATPGPVISPAVVGDSLGKKRVVAAGDAVPHVYVQSSLDDPHESFLRGYRGSDEQDVESSEEDEGSLGHGLGTMSFVPYVDSSSLYGVRGTIRTHLPATVPHEEDTSPASASWSSSGPNDSFDLHAAGPFNPSFSLSRCAAAADALFAMPVASRTPAECATSALMLEGLMMGNNNSQSPCAVGEVPSLTPFTACGFVLAAYVTFMRCLLVQMGHGPGEPCDLGTSRSSSSSSVLSSSSTSSYNTDIKTTTSTPLAPHDQVRHFRCLAGATAAMLDGYAEWWEVARGYGQEIKALLAANAALYH